MPQHTIAIIALLLVTCIWGSAFVITKAAIGAVPPIMLALLRFAVASAILLPLALRRQPLTSPALRSAWPTIAGMALTGVALFQLGANLALRYTTASQAVIIQAVIPVITALLAAMLLRERPPQRRVLGITLSLAGVALVVLAAVPSDAASDPLLGGVLLLASALGWSVYTILAKRIAGTDQLAVTAYSIALGTLLLVPLSVLEVGTFDVVALDWPAWASVLYLGALSTAAANLIYNRSLGHLDASQVATFLNLVPVVGVAVAVLFLGEPLIGWQLAGGGLVLLGVWLAT